MSTTTYIGALPEIIDSIPEIRKLNFPDKDRTINFIEKKIQKLNIKIRNSCFLPCDQDDPLNLNHDSDGAIKKWIIQFPEKYRLPALLSVLSTIYITENEFDCFLKIAIQKLTEAIKIKTEKSSFSPNNSHRVTLPVPYTFSNNLAFKKYIYLTNTVGILDGNLRPVRGIFENLLDKNFLSLRILAENGNRVYFDENWSNIERLINSFLNSNIVLIEDCSFSGTTIKSEINRLKKLLEIIFVPYEKDIKKNGYSIPNLYILVPITTDIAIKEIDSTLSGNPAINKYLNPVVTGYSFDYSLRFHNDIPENIMSISEYSVQ